MSIWTINRFRYRVDGILKFDVVSWRYSVKDYKALIRTESSAQTVLMQKNQHSHEPDERKNELHQLRATAKLKAPVTNDAPFTSICFYLYHFHTVQCCNYKWICTCTYMYEYVCVSEFYSSEYLLPLKWTSSVKSNRKAESNRWYYPKIIQDNPTCFTRSAGGTTATKWS
jgi:hypothetical protein